MPQEVQAIASLELDPDSRRREAAEGHRESTRDWWRAFGGFLICFNVWGLPISFGAFQNFYTLQYLSNYSPSTISWIGTAQGSLLVLMGLISGPLYDLGYWPHLFLAGSFLTVFGMMMLSLSTEYYQIFLSQGVCTGLGCGLLFVPLLGLIGTTFSHRRALAMGVVTSGIAFDGVVFTIIYVRLLPRLGFNWMVRIMGFINLAAFLAAAPTVLRISRISGSARAMFDREALTDVPFLIFTIALFFVFLGYLVPLYYIPTFAQVVLNSDESTALYILVGAQAASFFGRMGATLPVPYIGVMIPWMACCGISGILCLIWIIIKRLNSFIAFSVLYGFFSGALIALPPSVFPIICPDPKKLGSRMGVSWTSSALAFLIGTPIAGAIIDLENADLLGVQVWSGAMLLFSNLLLLFLWILMARKHKRALI